MYSQYIFFTKNNRAETYNLGISCIDYYHIRL